ncbi:MAG: DNA repair protein RadC [Bacteroidia bacterium]|jgi:DNA repair protein RadC|nr:DNA repair protein RadC [Bacteroidota bacterium]MCF8194165.1 DNA repair protein RadC [Bacteroidia bacterium]
METCPPTRSQPAIRDLPEQSRPRERLINLGRSNLEDRELLAILLGSGTGKESALGLAGKILGLCRHQLGHLGQIHVRQLAQIPGIGPAKAVKILAALELGKRCLESKTEEQPQIRGSADVFTHCKNLFLHKNHEIFAIALLNQANRILGIEQISEGGINFTAADPRIILRLVLDYRACGLILMHNHPSGQLQPSDADRSLTQKIESAARYLDVRVLDHLIFAQHRYFSFADAGLLIGASPSSNP